MKTADDYVAWVKSVIALCPVVVRFSLIREEILTDRGLWRYRLTLQDESLLELFEFFIKTTQPQKLGMPNYVILLTPSPPKCPRRSPPSLSILWENVYHWPQNWDG